MAANPGFPLTLDVKGYPVLVSGEMKRPQKRLSGFSTPAPK